MMPDEPENPLGESEKPPIKIERADDFRVIYANNVVADSTAWDLRLTFGMFDQSADHSVNKQQFAAVIPFGVAKLVLYWIEAAVIAHEIETGHRIGIRENVLPP